MASAVGIDGVKCNQWSQVPDQIATRSQQRIRKNCRPWHLFRPVPACTYESGRQPLNLNRKGEPPMRLRINTAAVLIMATATLASLCRAQSPGSPPERIDMTFVTPADPSVCTFPVEIHITGKSKAFNLPGNRMVITAPGQNATVT